MDGLQDFPQQFKNAKKEWAKKESYCGSLQTQKELFSVCTWHVWGFRRLFCGAAESPVCCVPREENQQQQIQQLRPFAKWASLQVGLWEESHNFLQLCLWRVSKEICSHFSYFHFLRLCDCLCFSFLLPFQHLLSSTSSFVLPDNTQTWDEVQVRLLNFMSWGFGHGIFLICVLALKKTECGGREPDDPSPNKARHLTQLMSHRNAALTRFTPKLPKNHLLSELTNIINFFFSEMCFHVTRINII